VGFLYLRRNCVERIFFLLAYFLVSVSAQTASAQSVVTATKSLAPFSKVSFEIAGDLEVLPSAGFDYTVRAEQKVIDALAFAVERDGLRIYAPKGYRTQQGVKVTVRLPRLTSLTSEGSGDVVIGAVECKTIKLVANGSGSVSAKNLNCVQLELEAAGSGDITIAGRANSASILSSGSGSIDASAFAVADVRVKQDGSGDVSVNANKSVTGSLEGSGDLNVRGAANPKVTVSGAGSVNKTR
jgi:hypothetical protein